jgi:Fe2+ or Zn2+ uptake regulation protein
MPAPGQTLRYALSACLVAGVRVTGARRAALEALAASPVPVVVEEFVRAQAAAAGVHPVTIYRFLAGLEARGVAHRFTLGGRGALMLACASAEYTLCSRCGAVRATPELPELHAWERAIAARTGFQLAHHWYEANGLCAACRPPVADA